MFISQITFTKNVRAAFNDDLEKDICNYFSRPLPFTGYTNVTSKS